MRKAWKEFIDGLKAIAEEIANSNVWLREQTEILREHKAAVESLNDNQVLLQEALEALRRDFETLNANQLNQENRTVILETELEAHRNLKRHSRGPAKNGENQQI